MFKIDGHSSSNKHYTRVWKDTANENNSKLFIALGVDARGDLQVYPIEELPITDVPKVLREAADRIEQGNTAGNGAIVVT